MLKIFISDLIMNSEKRKKCVELYTSVEKTIQTSLIDKK